MSTDARALSIRLAELLRLERGALADFVIALSEFDRGRRWLELGYPNLFQFLVRDLGLSNGGAYHRKIAAELLQRYPEVLEPLRDGRLCVSALPALAKVITPENRLETLPRFFHCSKRDAQAVAAEIMPVADTPQRDVITVLRTESSYGPPGVATERAGELFDQATAGSAALVAGGVAIGVSCVATGAAMSGHADTGIGAAPITPQAAAPAPLTGLPLNGTIQVEHRVDAAREVQLAPASATSAMSATSAPFAASLAPSPPQTQQRPADEVQPLTADLRRLHFTVSRRFLAKLDAARDALSHSRAASTTEDVLEAALDLLLQQHARGKGIVAKPRRVGRQIDAGTSCERREAPEGCTAGLSSGRAAAMMSDRAAEITDRAAEITGRVAGISGRAARTSGCAAAASSDRSASRNSGPGTVSKSPAPVTKSPAPVTKAPAPVSKAPAPVSSGASSAVGTGGDETNTARHASSGETARVANSNIPDPGGERREVREERSLRGAADGTNTALATTSGAPAAATRQLLLAAPPGPAPKSERIPASVRREVWKRDRGRCQWPLASGGICGSTLRLEFDHIVPRARGGPSTIANLRVLCRVHNQHSARRAFGDEWMDRYRRSGSG